MIPYFGFTTFTIGDLQVHVYGALVVTAILIARLQILKRAENQGVDGGSMSRLCIAMLITGFLGADVIKTATPNLGAFFLDPALVLRESRGVASLGGLGGGLLGGVLWCRLCGFNPNETLSRLDIIAHFLPLAWLIGPLGCALVHDHRGFTSNSWLAVRFPDGPAYDLGVLDFFSFAC